ncbi:hypothetical protein AB205_0161080, partial [Aquarana catesbeiana]
MDHMISSMRMEEDPSHVTERILDLTLEIIYLLTGESFPPVKSGDHLTITVPSSHLLKPKRNNEKMILELANKIIDLLTGEVPIRCQNVMASVGECLEGHKDLYKDVASPDGSSNENPPERCPRPLDSTQKSHIISHRVKEEIKEEDEVGVMEDSSGHNDPFKHSMMERFSETNCRILIPGHI